MSDSPTSLKKPTLPYKYIYIYITGMKRDGNIYLPNSSGKARCRTGWSLNCVSTKYVYKSHIFNIIWNIGSFFFFFFFFFFLIKNRLNWYHVIYLGISFSEFQINMLDVPPFKCFFSIFYCRRKQNGKEKKMRC